MRFSGRREGRRPGRGGGGTVEEEGKGGGGAGVGRKRGIMVRRVVEASDEERRFGRRESEGDGNHAPSVSDFRNRAQGRGSTAGAFEAERVCKVGLTDSATALAPPTSYLGNTRTPGRQLISPHTNSTHPQFELTSL